MKNYILNILLYKYPVFSSTALMWLWSLSLVSQWGHQILWWPVIFCWRSFLPIALVNPQIPGCKFMISFWRSPQWEPLPHSLLTWGRCISILKSYFVLWWPTLTWRPRVLTNTQLSKCPSVSWAAIIRTGSFILPLSPLKLTRGGWGGQGRLVVCARHC